MDSVLSILVNNGIGVACAAAVLAFAWVRETRTIPQMLETFATLVREERAIYQTWHEENRARLDRVFEETKENRHYMKNLAHQLGMKQAVEAEQRKDKEMRIGE